MRRWKLRVTRNSLLFVVGLLGIAHQTLVEHIDRPALLAVFSAMMGLPLFLAKDEKKADAVTKDAAKPEQPEQVKAEEQ